MSSTGMRNRRKGSQPGSVPSAAPPQAPPAAAAPPGNVAPKDFDVTRARIRLEGLASYPVVTTLLMNAAMGLNNSTPKTILAVPDDASSREANMIMINNVVTVLFALLSATTVSLGAYTTIIYTLMSIYSKTALGMGEDAKFLNFFRATSYFRASGYRAFIVALIGYTFCWSMSNFLKNEGLICWLQTVPAFVVAFAGAAHYKMLMDLASDVVFS